jgi:hypothetical protein
MRADGAASTPGLHCGFVSIDGGATRGEIAYLSSREADGDNSQLVALAKESGLDHRGGSHDV